jgi:hypothetical protein
MSADRTLLRVVAFLVGVAVLLLCGVYSFRRHRGPRFDTASSSCPISWAAYTYGTNHAFYFQKSGPLPAFATQVLDWNDRGGWHLPLNRIFRTVPCNGYSPEPALMVHVFLKHPLAPGSRPEFRTSLINEAGRRWFPRMDGLGAHWMFYFTGLTGDVHGCVVEFTGIEDFDLVARLRL